MEPNDVATAGILGQTNKPSQHSAARIGALLSAAVIGLLCAIALCIYSDVCISSFARLRPIIPLIDVRFLQYHIYIVFLATLLAFVGWAGNFDANALLSGLLFLLSLLLSPSFIYTIFGLLSAVLCFLALYLMNKCDKIVPRGHNAKPIITE